MGGSENVLLVFVGFLVGLFTIIMGWVIKKYQYVQILAGYDVNKHSYLDEKKISDFVGYHFFIAGLIMVIASIFTIFLDFNLFIISIIIYSLLILKMVVHLNINIKNHRFDRKIEN
ncbi:hypothetical protein Y919_08075 [Caloranaerobacter azorensis H53214]|uniref:DUF3784 domain-containing protein n=1 Tax=Caloranaerobacter azorensis H53214 TaxID=1156417 RepID=A0A096BG18_9FIRM|nr:DUF3784 domain-containing protein [Caloranaerobacter azorensis]KGG80115.1 hypothetical protein Y919_08075 [Caloranaerobacter azorensis H53214]